MPFADYINYPNVIAPANWVGGSTGIETYVGEQKDAFGFWESPLYGAVQPPAYLAVEPGYLQYPFGPELSSGFDVQGLSSILRSRFYQASVEIAYRGSIFGFALAEQVLLRRLFIRGRPVLNDLTNYAPVYDELRVFGHDSARDASLPPTGVTLTPANQASLQLVSSVLDGGAPVPFDPQPPLTSRNMGFVSERVWMLELAAPLPVQYLRIASTWAFMNLRLLGIHIDSLPVGTSEAVEFWTGFTNTRERVL